MRQRMRAWGSWIVGIAADVDRNRATLAAGGLAYFVALALAPAAVAFGSLAGLVLDPQQVSDTLQSFASDAPVSADHVQSAINVLVNLVASSSTGSFTVTTIVSVVVAVYASSKVVLGVRQAMDTAFRVPVRRSGIIERGIAAVITLIGLVVAVAIVIVITVLPRVLDWLGLGTLSTTSGSWLVDWAVVLVLIYFAVRWTLHHGPNMGQRVPWTSFGVIVTSVWILGATGGVGLYARYSSSLGAAVLVFGTAVVILLWLYLCFLGLLWGAAIEAARQRRGVSAASPGAVAE